MRASLKEIICFDIEDLPNYIPQDPDNVGLYLHLMVGPEDSEGDESFQVTVCTPKWLSAIHKKDDIVVGRHYLIIFEYDYDRLVPQLDILVNQCEGDNWNEIGQKVARLGFWEFEDYKPYEE